MVHVAENTIHGSYGIQNNMYTKPHMIYEQKGPQRVFEQNPKCSSFWAWLVIFFLGKLLQLQNLPDQGMLGKNHPLQSPPIFWKTNCRRRRWIPCRPGKQRHDLRLKCTCHLRISVGLGSSLWCKLSWCRQKAKLPPGLCHQKGAVPFAEQVAGRFIGLAAGPNGPRQHGARHGNSAKQGRIFF